MKLFWKKNDLVNESILLKKKLNCKRIYLVALKVSSFFETHRQFSLQGNQYTKPKDKFLMEIFYVFGQLIAI